MMARYVSYLLLLVPAALGVLVLRAMRGRRRPADAAPVCGKCGYDVRGLPGPVCPECGSDLRVVGIRRPGDREPLGARGRLVTWTLFVFLSVLVPLAALWNEVERRWLIVYDASHTTTFLAPRSGAYQTIRFDYRVRRYGGNAPSQQEPAPLRLTLTLTLNGNAVRTMEVSAAGSRNAGPGYRYRDSAGRTIESASGFDEHFLTDWMSDAGVPAIASLQVGQEIAEVFRRLRQTMQATAGSANTIVTATDPFLGGGGGMSSSTFPARWSGYVLPAASAAVWAVGLPFVLGRRQRETRH